MTLSALGIFSAAGAGGGPTFQDAYEHIATAVPSGVAFVTFSSIPQDYKHLQIRYVAKSTGNFDTSLVVNFNNNTSAIYADHYLRGSSSTIASNNSFPDTKITMLLSVTRSNVSGAFSAGVLDILDYSNTTKNTTLRSFYGSNENSAVALQSGLFRNTAAISTIKLDNQRTLDSATRFSLYGIRG
jgi:hypothetical protein